MPTSCPNDLPGPSLGVRSRATYGASVYQPTDLELRQAQRVRKDRKRIGTKPRG
jgi:hypothetical protein